jgi:hypothetical protein
MPPKINLATTLLRGLVGGQKSFAFGGSGAILFTEKLYESYHLEDITVIK